MARRLCHHWRHNWRWNSDAALALGMCNVLVQEDLYDENFVAHRTTGFEEFAQYVQHFRPEVVEHITGVPAHTVVSLAREMAGAGGVAQLMYTGMEYSNSGVQGIRATLVLWALAGQLDVPGGCCFSMPGSRFPVNREGLIKNPVANPRLGRDRFPLYIHYRDEAHAETLVLMPLAVGLEGGRHHVQGRHRLVEGIRQACRVEAAAGILYGHPQRVFVAPEFHYDAFASLLFLMRAKGVGHQLEDGEINPLIGDLRIRIPDLGEIREYFLEGSIRLYEEPERGLLSVAVNDGSHPVRVIQRP